ncbi:MAG: radical SAM protein, partial [Clostridiales bacterium]|nr:radical SAM protein [Clostridiales bacterium]
MQIQEADATAKKLRVAAASLGCKVNSYDTQAMLGLFADRGYEIVPFEELADIYIVNTCAVTNTGGKKSRQMARRAAAANPGAVVVACGCQTQAKPEEFAEMPGVDLVLGTWRSGIVDAVEEILAKRQEKPVVRVGDVLHDHAYEPIALGSASALGSAGAFGRIRANLKVQDGCGRFCAYCIIPYARGPSRSRDMEDAVNEAKSLAAQGLKEIVLAGIHLASYGQDLYNSDLTGLILRLQEVAGIERIRLGSLEPGSISVPFLEALKMAPKVCGHFHLSLQSGCDKTL